MKTNFICLIFQPDHLKIFLGEYCSGKNAVTEESLVRPEYSLLIVGVLFQPADVRYACSDILTPFVCQ